MNFNTFGIVGADGAGKSTVGRIISELLTNSADKRRVHSLPFATDLKQMVRELDPILGARQIGKGVEAVRISDLIGEGYTEQEIKDTYPEYRRVLRTLGTDCLRSRDDKFWIGRLMKRIEELELNCDDLIIIDDIRFRNEADAACVGIDVHGRRNDGMIIRVEGRGGEVGPGEQHGQIISDYTIRNVGSIESTVDQVKEMLTLWGFKL